MPCPPETPSLRKQKKLSRATLFSGVLALAGWLMTGCETPGNDGTAHLMITTAAEAETGVWAKPRQSISAKDAPVVRVTDCEGKAVTVQIVDLATGRIVGTVDGKIAEAHMATRDVEVPHITADETSFEYVHRKRAYMQKQMGILPLNGLAPGSYNARLLVDGQVLETAAFSVTP